MNRNVSPLTMEHLTRGDRMKGRSDHRSDSDEAEYHQPEEPVIRHHFPRGHQPNREFTDRPPPRPWTPWSGRPEECRSVQNIPTRPPKRSTGNAAPPINRDLKPGRQPKLTSERRSQTLGSEETTPKLPSRPVKSLPRDQGSHFSPPRLPQSNDQEDDSPPHRPPPNAPPRPAYNDTHTCTDRTSPGGRRNVNSKFLDLNPTMSHRLSLDLETHDLERSCIEQTNKLKDSVRQQHHEWPQAKGDANHGSYTGHCKPVEAFAVQDWYIGSFSRVEAEHALHLVNQEGAFLVRDCSKHTTNEPYVLAVFYEHRVFNIQIRFCEETCKYTLGTRVKTNDTFDSVADIIKFHSIFPIVLIDGRNPLATSQPKRHCTLMYPVTAQDMNQLLR